MYRNFKFAGWLIVTLITVRLLTGCDDLESIKPETQTVQTDLKGGLFILCEGNYSLNNSTLACYNFESTSLDKDFFNTVNGRKLGDTGNDMQRYGSKIYIVVNASSQIDVLDAVSGKSLKQIPLFEGTKARQPRYVTFWEDKAYVCSFDGTVARVDTSTLEMEALTVAGRNPDGITAANGKLYVSNSGGLDYNTSVGYDNTVSVIDVTTFSEIKRITVGQNPYRIKTDDYGYVWVACRGDYKDEAASFWCIETGNDEVVTDYPLEVLGFDLYGDLAYLYNYDQASNESWISVFNLKDRQVVRDAFITDGTTIHTPYGIKVNAENGDVFITDAGDYVSSGSVYCFKEDGTLRFRLNQVGVSPNTVLYVPDFITSATLPEDSSDLIDPYIERVYDYSPAPGQFVGLYPAYVTGYNADSMRRMAEVQLKGKTSGLVTLGRYGGSLTFAFKKSVLNQSGGTDFAVYGNAFSNGAEPGIVEVSQDVNQNGLPDDAWYELAGSDYSKQTTVHNYRLVYYKPPSLTDSVFYRDNQGLSGFLSPGFPVWKPDSMVWSGSKLGNTAVQDSLTGYWSLKSLEWGYVDNKPNNTDACQFDLDWAVDKNGTPVQLDSIQFVRVYTGVNQQLGWLGELSTEVTGAENLSR